MIECLSMINNNLIRGLVETFFRCFVKFPTVTHKIMVKLEDLLDISFIYSFLDVLGDLRLARP